MCNTIKYYHDEQKFINFNAIPYAFDLLQHLVTTFHGYLFIVLDALENVLGKGSINATMTFTV